MMDKKDTLERISELGLLAVIRGPTPELAIRMVQALVAGGVLGIEITYSTPHAARVAGFLREKYGEEILLGMGTLTLPEQVSEAVAAGVSFLVCPHCEEELARRMVESGLVVMVGGLTPSEVLRAYRLGSDIVKLFPGSLVGPEYLKALRGPFPDIPIIPTGGVTIENIPDWFSAGAYAVGAGSNLCPTEWAKERRFAEIYEQARAFVQAVNCAR